MAQASEPAVQCRSCGAVSFSVGQHNVPQCDYCGQPLAPSGGRCPRCETPIDLDARACHACGARLALPCPACGILNPMNIPRCIVCSQTLTGTDALFERITTRTKDQLRQARDRGHRVKAQEEMASRARLARMWAEEEREQQAIAEAQAKQNRRERRILIGVIVLVGLAILVLIIVSLLSVTQLYPSFHPHA